MNSFLRKPNLDVYVIGSNSKFLSSDIATEFRGRGDVINVFPLSYKEFLEGYNGKMPLNEYITFGGMPQILVYKTDEAKINFLKTLFDTTYTNDIIERYNIKNIDKLNAIINLISSSIGSLTNPNKIRNSFISAGLGEISVHTIDNYLNFLQDAFLIEKADRFDIKGKKYLSTPSKYYFTDLGLRNARLNFRQQDQTHLMENLIYNELKTRMFNIDVGIIETNEKNNKLGTSKKQIEIDFVCNKGNEKYYIQSAFSIPNGEKAAKEQRPFNYIPDSFRKIIIVRDEIKKWINEEGTTFVSLQEFLLDDKFFT